MTTGEIVSWAYIAVGAAMIYFSEPRPDTWWPIGILLMGIGIGYSKGCESGGRK